MSNLTSAPEVEGSGVSPASGPKVEAIPGIVTSLGGLPIRRLLPRSRRRLVGPWCFCDSFGPLVFESGKPMDVPPHPHIGLQTVSWLLEGEVMHHDSLGLRGLARPGILNLMTAGRGIAHAEETPAAGSGRLRGVQLWVALPDAHRETDPAFAQHASLPVVETDGGQATVFLGRLGAAQAEGRTFWPMVGADLTARPHGRFHLELDPGFEHALVLLDGAATLDGRLLERDTLYYLGSSRRDLDVTIGDAPLRALLLGGAPFSDPVLMWWNFVARSADAIAAARDDWRAGRRFGDVRAYAGDRLDAPPLVSRPVPNR